MSKISVKLFYKTLVESTKALPWKVDCKTMAFSYVGPQIKEMFGWNVEDWAGIDPRQYRGQPAPLNF